MDTEKFTSGRISNTSTYEFPYTFDKTDKKIISCLNTNARQTLAQIAKKTGLTRDVIRHRIKLMVKNRVILNFKPIFNPPVMGFPTVNYICISLHHPSPTEESRFIKYLVAHKRITHVASLIGKWDYIIDIIAKDPGEFSKILKQIRQEFPELIKEYEVSGVLDEYKYEEIAPIIE